MKNHSRRLRKTGENNETIFVRLSVAIMYHPKKIKFNFFPVRCGARDQNFVNPQKTGVKSPLLSKMKGRGMGGENHILPVMHQSFGGSPKLTPKKILPARCAVNGGTYLGWFVDIKNNLHLPNKFADA